MEIRPLLGKTQHYKKSHCFSTNKFAAYCNLMKYTINLVLSARTLRASCLTTARQNASPAHPKYTRERQKAYSETNKLIRLSPKLSMSGNSSSHFCNLAHLSTSKQTALLGENWLKGNSNCTGIRTAHIFYSTLTLKVRSTKLPQ